MLSVSFKLFAGANNFLSSGVSKVTTLWGTIFKITHGAEQVAYCNNFSM